MTRTWPLSLTDLDRRSRPPLRAFLVESHRQKVVFYLNRRAWRSLPPQDFQVGVGICRPMVSRITAKPHRSPQTLLRTLAERQFVGDRLATKYQIGYLQAVSETQVRCFRSVGRNGKFRLDNPFDTTLCGHLQAPVAGNGFRGFSILPLAMQSAWRNMTLRGPFVISTALEKDRASPSPLSFSLPPEGSSLHLPFRGQQSQGSTVSQSPLMRLDAAYDGCVVSPAKPPPNLWQ